MEKQLLTGTLNTLPPADSSATSITYKLVVIDLKKKFPCQTARVNSS